MKLFLYFVSVLLAFASCRSTDESTAEVAEKNVRDTLSLYVAVCPNEACLPLYYAEATGILDSIEANITLMHLGTMEDCDTALTNSVAEVAVTDLARLICMSKNGIKAVAVAQIPSSLALFTAKGKRLNGVKQLKERIVALERHAESDYWSDKLLEGTGLEQLDLFRTQFNSHNVRTEMLGNGLVEAAFLDWPYCVMAKAQGANCIWTKKPDDQSWTVFAMLQKTLDNKRRISQTMQLFEVYNVAADRLSRGVDSLCTDSILKNIYALPAQAVDSIPGFRQPSARALKKVNPSDVQAAKDWLVKRQWVNSALPTGHICNDTVLK